MSNIYDKFTNLYPLSKTLRFELIPQGKTLENMKANHVIEDDEVRAISYKKAKKLIDEYHKSFINKCMENYEINSKELTNYYEIYKDKNRNDDEYKKLKEKLRKGISEAFTKNDEYKDIFSKKIITDILPAFKSEKEDTSVLDEFAQFYTYFSGFNENRKNMYVADEKSTAIAYRLVDENLPMFAENIDKYNYAKSVIGADIKQVEEDLKEYIQVGNIGEMFKIESYNDVLSQRGIDVYNTIIGGKSLEDGTKIKGLNEYINLYRQTHQDDKKIAKLNILYKQVLSDRESASFVIDKFESDQKVLEAINELSVKIQKNVIDKGLERLLKNIEKYDLSKIYVRNDLSITNISQALYSDWNTISQAIKDDYDNNFGIPKNDKQEENKKKYLKSRKNLSIEFLNECTNENEKYIPVQKYFSDCIVGEQKKENIFEKINKAYEKVKVFIKNEYTGNIKEDTKSIELLKEYLDSLKGLQLFIKPLIAVRFDEDKEKDNKFYDALNTYWDEMLDITPMYNKVRNYVTGKPYSTDKIKLNFNNPTLLDGWDVNKEPHNKSIILRKDGMYYLAILDKKLKGTLECQNNIEDNSYEKMNYKLLPGANKMLPKVFFSEKNADVFKPSFSLLEKYKKGLHKKGDLFDIKFCHELIDYFKYCISIHPDWSKFGFIFSDTNTYEDMSGFYREVEEQGYKVSFSRISEKYIEDLIDDGLVYLFQIYNKDFSRYSHGKKNLHTLYWNMLFSEENLKDVVYKLNGEAELFYRKASIKKDITHPKNMKINNKNENNPRKQSEFDYDLIKDKRYTEDKFLFHVPISMNFKADGVSRINEFVNKAIKYNDDNYVIGIDRGERHLLYLSLVDSKGNIVEQYTLNDIININKGIEYKTDYHKLLDYKEKEREAARESWQSIENIKNLKEGYLSQVINKITDLMIKYNAIVVLEDLNFGFMRGRQKFEKQVYQKFEKMLIDKLNYLVKKNIDVDKPGGLLHAYQLTNQFESFKKLGKQSGFLFYIPAWNTSKMDPVTGYVNFFYVKYENESKAKEFFKKFDSIRYNKDKKYFEFDIDYSKFGTRAEGTKLKWKICSYGNRVKTYRNPEKNSEWDSEEIDITEALKTLFNQYGINYEGESFKDSILSVNGKEFWEKLIYLFKLVIQMRNSITGTTTDYIISPVADENGEFFDSRSRKEGLPKDADANGAYNIARKGLWVIKQIKNTSDDKLKNVKLAITNKEWLEFIQNKEYEI